MDTVKAQADLATLQSELSRLMADTQATRRWERWTTPMVTSSFVFFIGTCCVVCGVMIAKLLAH
jgi:hypothetical protein